MGPVLATRSRARAGARVGESTKQAERALADLAHDELTGLVTRRLVRRALEDRLASGPALAVFFCDLDGFKTINDLHGHAEGDRRLQALGQGLRRWQTVTGSLVGRWGGDEFVVLTEVPDNGRIDVLVTDLTTAVEGDGELSASIGAVIGLPGDEALSVIRMADDAMCSAKRSARASA